MSNIRKMLEFLKTYQMQAQSAEDPEMAQEAADKYHALKEMLMEQIQAERTDQLSRGAGPVSGLDKANEADYASLRGAGRSPGQAMPANPAEQGRFARQQMPTRDLSAFLAEQEKSSQNFPSSSPIMGTLQQTKDIPVRPNGPSANFNIDPTRSASEADLADLHELLMRRDQADRDQALGRTPAPAAPQGFSAADQQALPINPEQQSIDPSFLGGGQMSQEEIQQLLKMLSTQRGQ